MLLLSSAQLGAMGEARRQDFIHRLEGFLAPAAGMEPMPTVAARIEAARHLGLTAERDAAAFAAAGEVFGPRFHDRVPAAVRLLRTDAAAPGSAAGLRDLAVRAAAVLDRAVPGGGAAPDLLARRDLVPVLAGGPDALSSSGSPGATTLPFFDAVPARAGTALEGAEAAQRAVEQATEPGQGGGLSALARRVAERVDDAIDNQVDELTRPFRDLRDDAIAIRDGVLDLPAAAEQAVEAAKEKLRAAGRDVVDAVKAEVREATGEIGDTAAAGAKVVRDAVKQAGQDLLAGHAMDLGSIRCAVEDLVRDVLDKVGEVASGLAGRLLGAATQKIESIVDDWLGRAGVLRDKLGKLVGDTGTLVDKVGRLFDNIGKSFDATDFSALLTPCPNQAGGKPAENASPPPSARPPASRQTGGIPAPFPAPVIKPPAPPRPTPGRPIGSAPPKTPSPVLPAPPAKPAIPRPAPPRSIPPGTYAAPPPPPVPELSAADREALNELHQDLGQAALDIVGIFDPTPVADVANSGWSVLRGNWLDAGLSLLGVIPYLGDLAKVGKLPRMAASIDRALALSQRSAAARRALQAPLDVLRKTIGKLDVSKLPDSIRRPVQDMQAKLARLDGPPVLPVRRIEDIRVGDLSARAIRQGNNGKVAVIGKHMGSESAPGVRQYAAGLRENGYQVELFDGSPPIPTAAARDWQARIAAVRPRRLTPDEVRQSPLFAENQRWAQKLRDEGYTVVDIGIPRDASLDPSAFYDIEQQILFGGR
jgi:hypothetical protein